MYLVLLLVLKLVLLLFLLLLLLQQEIKYSFVKYNLKNADTFCCLMTVIKTDFCKKENVIQKNSALQYSGRNLIPFQPFFNKIQRS